MSSKEVVLLLRRRRRMDRRFLRWSERCEWQTRRRVPGLLVAHREAIEEREG